MFEAIRSDGGRLDVLENNAAITGQAAMGPELDQPLDDLERIIAFSPTAGLALSQLAGRLMVENGGGAIVNVSSIDGGFLIY